MALKFLETKTPDLVFLDYEMPVENGPEVFKKIKKMDSAMNVPVVFLTGIADREKITEVLALKPHGYLLKPINMERVNETINKLLG
ncbi:MAG: response regulator [Oscillospiraceae bacterium]